MPEIVLATLNAKYPHCAFGLRYLFANLGELQPRSVIREFTIQQSPLEIVEAILADSPRIVGFGVYIWNASPTMAVVSALRRLRPGIVMILGGPEVSYETAEQPVCRLADYVITGEADLAFAALCQELLAGRRMPLRCAGGELGQVIPAATPPLAEVALPYDFYTDEDVAHRVIYVEASRGCPFTCEFCLSALDIPVRQFPLAPFLAAMQRLIDRGARLFKFVDRTFNLNLRVSRAILEFFHARYTPGLFLHFEMIPDRFPESLKDIIREFPPGAIQFEVGIQTWNDDVAELISRRQDNAAAETNLTWLRDHTGVHVHADLIAGLPGEDLGSFAQGFDRLAALGPHEIQVGILKRLRGTPIVRHDATYSMVYSAEPPYEVLQTADIDFATMQALRRFAKTWDLIANSGNFVETTRWFWGLRSQATTLYAGIPSSETAGAATEIQKSDVQKPRVSENAGLPGASPFWAIWDFTAWLHARTGRTHAIALPRLVELVFGYLTERCRVAPADIAPVLLGDYRRGGRSDTPACLRRHVGREPDETRTIAITVAPKRQQRHRAGTND